jgi:ubiquinone/menaquinone biosynthesis C-methylase UbiE
MDSVKLESSGAAPCPRRNGSFFPGPGSFAPPRRFDPANPEFIDRPDTAVELLRDELRELEINNRRSGAHRTMIRRIEQFLPAPNVTLRILDLGTGGADIPRAVATWARSRNVSVSITAVDGNPNVLRFAQESCRDFPEIRLEHHDMRNLPFAAGSFDLVLCSLALHHFDEPDAIAILRCISRVAARGYIVNDLRRNWISIWTMNILALVFLNKGIIRNDGPQSCRAAFTMDELAVMAHAAGLGNCQITSQDGIFRMVLEGRK